MTEPVAYLVSQEPLSSVRWLSDVKPIGVDNKQITPLYTAEQLHPRVKMTQAEFDLFSENNHGLRVFEQLEEHIEVDSNMKWFVRLDSQIPLPDENIYLDDELIVCPHYDSPKSSSHQFDTKEEAEKWTNPLTEVVQLPQLRASDG